MFFSNNRVRARAAVCVTAEVHVTAARTCAGAACGRLACPPRRSAFAHPPPLPAAAVVLAGTHFTARLAREGPRRQEGRKRAGANRSGLVGGGAAPL